MPANGRRDLIRRLKVKYLPSGGNGELVQILTTSLLSNHCRQMALPRPLSGKYSLPLPVDWIIRYNLTLSLIRRGPRICRSGYVNRLLENAQLVEVFAKYTLRGKWA